MTPPYAFLATAVPRKEKRKTLPKIVAYGCFDENRLHSTARTNIKNSGLRLFDETVCKRRSDQFLVIVVTQMCVVSSISCHPKLCSFPFFVTQICEVFLFLSPKSM